jgi:hypothetical protein
VFKPPITIGPVKQNFFGVYVCLIDGNGTVIGTVGGITGEKSVERVLMRGNALASLITNAETGKVRLVDD